MIGRLSNRLRAFVRDERGISLMELLVAMTVTTIILVAIGGFVTAAIKGSAVNVTADLNARQASTAMTSLTRYLHVATTLPRNGQVLPDPAFVAASSTDITFYTYVNLSSTDEQPIRVRFYQDPTTKGLVQSVTTSTYDATSGYYSFPAGAASTNTTLTGPIATPTSDSLPLFSFQQLSGADVDSSTGGVVPAASLGTINSVVVNLEVGSTTAGASGNAHDQTTVYLLNIGQGAPSTP